MRMSNRCHIFLWWLNELLLSGDCSCEILWVVLDERVSFSLQMRVSKEQEHFLVLPDGLSYGEVTASNLVRHEHTRTRPAPPPESLSLGKAFIWRSPVWDCVLFADKTERFSMLWTYFCIVAKRHNAVHSYTKGKMQQFNFNTVVDKIITTLVFSAAKKWFKVSYFYLLL